MRTQQKKRLALRRRWRVRSKISGTPERPRMSVCFSNKHIRVQFIDDVNRVTLTAATSVGKGAPTSGKSAANAAGAKVIGARAAQVALEKGIKTVVFDRGSKRYHGKVKALADAAREAGLKF